MPEESKSGVLRGGRSGRFPRSARLLRHADFDRVYKAGKRHFSASMTVFYLVRPQDENGEVSGMRVGFTVGRVLGGAVVRNRMKRRLREAVRWTKPSPIVHADVVINPKKSLLDAEFEVVLNEMRRAFVVIERASAQYRVPSTEASNRKPRD